MAPQVARTRVVRAPKYGPEVVAVLRFCWAVLEVPTGKQLAAMVAELVPTLRRFGELDISDKTEAGLVTISAATIDRQLAGDRAKLQIRGRSHTKPGSLLKGAIPIRA